MFLANQFYLHLPPTFELENKWKSNDAILAVITAMIIKITDDFLDSAYSMCIEMQKIKDKVNLFTKSFM